ncbi:GGDEF domain-containing protein [Desulfovibrio ferrophilus]|uniref:diguanylate cyclase n=1 Tax=Desulfovibrio ferrophilus TaxID=241368 RepID=A0A2Z6AU60_9BACT|nr:GGDEF domain-containing protein [Desulfovibrio ferrophilus]BBD06758.1 diguanylate cyclase [Desulfovibrio ferrophilus]
MEQPPATFLGTNPKLTAFLAVPRKEKESAKKFCTRLAHKFGKNIFAEAIHFLSHIQLPADEAREHWIAIVNHRESMRILAERDIGLLATMIDYFTSVCPHLVAPVTLEADTLAQCQRLMMIDDLTGLFNRRYFTAELQKEIERSRRLKRPMALLMADIDHFKDFNDTFGHAGGDKALASVGSIMRKSARLMDQAIRYGGEEFAFILPHTSKEDAIVVAERLRVAMESHTPLDSVGDPLRPVTLSIGLSACPDDGEDPIALIEAADRALYRAKGQGRNQVCTQSDDYRRSKRYPAKASTQCQIRKKGATPVMARMLDLSTWGVRCEVPVVMEPGKDLSLMLQDKQKELTLSVTKARTVWAESANGGIWRTGITFSNLSTPQREGLHALLGVSPPSSD